MVLMRRVSSCSAALDWFDDHRPSQDDDNDLGDEDLPVLDDRKPGSSQIFDSFEISSPDMKVDPRFFKKSVDDSGDDNKYNTYRYPSEASIRMASLNESDIEESADDDNDDAKSDFEDSTQANFKYFDGKFVRRGSDFHIQASDDEDYSMPHPTLPMPTSRTYKWQNVDEGDVMPYNNLSSSSGPSAYRLPLEKELSRDIRGRLSLSPVNSLDRHAPESSTQPHETNLRNLVSLLEPGDAAGDRDHVMSDSTFTGYDASTSASFSNRGTDPLANKDLPLAHSQSASLIHPRSTIASLRLLAASEKKRTRVDGRKFPCCFCTQSFTAKHNLKSKSPTLQIFVAFLLMSVFQTILTLILVAKTTHAKIVDVGSLLRVLFVGITVTKGVKVLKPNRCWNPPNTQINLKTIRSVKWKDPCRGQRHVVTTRSGRMFSASCRTTSLLQL